MAPYDTGPKFYGWAQRLSDVLSQIHGLTATQLSVGGTSTEDWSNPDNEHGASLRTELGLNPKFVLLGLSLGNEDPGIYETANVSESQQCKAKFISGIKAAVDLAETYAVPTVIGGVYPNDLMVDHETMATYETNDEFTSTLPWAQGKYIDFLPAAAKCVDRHSAECGHWRAALVRHKQHTGALDPLHPNMLGYIAMYRAVDLHLFDAFTCNADYARLAASSTYVPPSESSTGAKGQCLHSDSTAPQPVTVFEGDHGAHGAWTGHELACRAYCTSVSCAAYDFMSDPTLDATAGTKARRCRIFGGVGATASSAAIVLRSAAQDRRLTKTDGDSDYVCHIRSSAILTQPPAPAVPPLRPGLLAPVAPPVPPPPLAPSAESAALAAAIAAAGAARPHSGRGGASSGGRRRGAGRHRGPAVACGGRLADASHVVPRVALCDHAPRHHHE